MNEARGFTLHLVDCWLAACPLLGRLPGLDLSPIHEHFFVIFCFKEKARLSSLS